MITLSSPPVSLSYVSSGLFVAHDEWIHADRVIDSWELIYMLNGAVYMRQADVSYTLEKGDLLLLRPGVPHGGVQISPPGVSFYWVHFLVSDAAAMARFPTHMAFADGYRFTPLFKQLLHIAGAPSPYPFHAADLAVGLILAQAAASSADDMPQAALLKDCAEWIRINSDRRITVAMAAERFGYHPDHLSALFQKWRGTPLKQYIDEQRLQYIRNLLLTSNYSIKQLAAYLGWENENQFTHYFKYHEKMSPTQYRSLYVNTHLNKR